jgi:aspartate-semialdehyde dehydrogenase
MKTGPFLIAIVGAGTLKGKEVVEVINDRNFPGRDTRLLDDDESLGQLEAVGEEVTFVQSVQPDNFDGIDFAFFASDENFTRRNWQMAQRAGSIIIDTSYGLENEPGALVRSPWLERQLKQEVPPDLLPGPVITAHPAAQILGLLLVRAQRAGVIRTAAATVLEPASERGRRGMDELHEQTVNVLSFRELPKNVYDAQVAFNVLARYGDKAAPTMEALERRVIGHFKRITAGQAPLPSLMLLQVPSFHGYLTSIYVEFESPVSLGDFSQALTGEHVDIVLHADDSPSNVNAAGQDNILLTVRRDSQRDHAFWLWAAADNLRLTALTAVEAAESLAAARPQGKVQ